MNSSTRKAYISEWFDDGLFCCPISCAPYAEALVISLRSEVPPYRVPRHTLHQPSVSSQYTNLLCQMQKYNWLWYGFLCILWVKQR